MKVKITEDTLICIHYTTMDTFIDVKNQNVINADETLSQEQRS